MSKSKHTPGPWRVEAAGEKVIEADTTDVIAQPGHNFSIINPSQTLQANARLIAAAPDLLAALERKMSSNPTDWVGVDDFASAAIAKARVRRLNREIEGA